MNQGSVLEMLSVESLREPVGLQVGSPGAERACKDVSTGTHMHAHAHTLRPGFIGQHQRQPRRAEQRWYTPAQVLWTSGSLTG